MKQSEHIDQLAAALSAAQAMIKGAIEDSTNPHFRSKYASLQSHHNAGREPLSKNGLAVTQGLETVNIDGSLMLSCETILMHKSGQWISSTLLVPIGKMDAQSFGSASTYARRYSYSAIVGIAPTDATDDDGNVATESAKAEPQPIIKKLPAAIAKAIKFATDADELMEWGKAQEKDIQTNPEFRQLFKAKLDTLKNKPVETI